MMVNYNRLAADYARHRRVHPVVLQHLLETGQVGPASRVLEVGCGTGNYLTALQAETGCHCWGIDPAKEMLKRAQQQRALLDLQLGRAEALPFADGSFHLVFSVDVIHHVQDRAAYMREAFRVLKPGGRFVTVTDSEAIIRNRVPLSAYFPETVAAELKRYPSMESLRAGMAAAGFRDLAEQLAEFPYELTDVQPFKDKAFSSLHLIAADSFRRGIERMEADLALGPIPCISRYALLWGIR